MAQISHINYKDILEAGRYDADFFMPIFLEMDKKIINGLNLSKIAKTVDLQSNGAFADIFKTLNDGNKKTIPYIRSTNVGDFFINKNSLDFISKEAHEKLLKTHTKNQDVLMARKGKIGGATIIFPEDVNLNTNDNVVNIKVTDERFNPFYITTFLNCKYGLLQVNRFATGNVQPWLSMYQVRILKVPLVGNNLQTEIEEIIKSAYQKQSQSKQLYKEAEEILLSELGLINYQIKNTLIFFATKKEINEAKRYDSEYFQPKYREIIEKIEKYQNGCDYADEIVKWKKGIEVGTNFYLETGKDFIRVSDFSKFGITESNRKISEDKFDELKSNYQPKIGEILFTKDGTIGLSYVVKENIDGIISGAFLRLTLKEKYKNFEKECLSLIFSSILCQMQVEKLSGGALIAHLKPSDFEKFKIPLIRPEIQQQIAEKIQESHRLRKESKELLDEAKRKVEEEIEK